jgi:hypothetical protein
MTTKGNAPEVHRNGQRDEPRGWIARRGPTFFFFLALGYLALLLALGAGREAGIWILDDLNDPIAGVLPLGVPWFGALGAVTLSLYGVFDHNDHWDRKWNYWHFARPFVGVVLAIIAYFIFITLISSTGLTPRTSATTTTSTTVEPTTTAIPTTQTAQAEGPELEAQPQPTAPPTTTPPDQTGGQPPGPSSLLPYYVLAFLVGFREATFRSLIKRAADVLLGPGDPGAPPAGIAIYPSPINFEQIPAGSPKEVTVTVSNSGTGDLRINPASASSPGTDLSDDNGVYELAANAVQGATIAPGSNATLRVNFRPENPGTYPATLTISSNAGTNPIGILGEGVPPSREAPQPQRARSRRLLPRGRNQDTPRS